MRIERIVVGIDFSASAVDGARWAARHFAPGAELVLAHVVDLPHVPGFLRGAAPPPEVMETAARDFAEAELAALARGLGGTVRTAIRTGRPHEELAVLAAEAGADLVLVGPHGDRPRPWKPLGTTAERLVRASPVPVLVATAVPDAPPRRVLVALDDAEITPHVLAWARHLAGSLGASVLAVHVLSTAAMSHVLSMAAVTTRSADAAAAQVDDAMRAVGTRWLERLVGAGSGTGDVSVAVTYGKPGDAILELAESSGADLLVLGRRGSGQVAPALLGSTVRTVLHGARCPVLVVAEERAPRG